MCALEEGSVFLAGREAGIQFTIQDNPASAGALTFKETIDDDTELRVDTAGPLALARDRMA